jgi:hypothetical protein
MSSEFSKFCSACVTFILLLALTACTMDSFTNTMGAIAGGVGTYQMVSPNENMSAGLALTNYSAQVEAERVRKNKEEAEREKYAQFVSGDNPSGCLVPDKGIRDLVSNKCQHGIYVTITSAKDVNSDGSYQQINMHVQANSSFSLDGETLDPTESCFRKPVEHDVSERTLRRDISSDAIYVHPVFVCPEPVLSNEAFASDIHMPPGFDEYFSVGRDFALAKRGGVWYQFHDGVYYNIAFNEVNRSDKEILLRDASDNRHLIRLPVMGGFAVYSITSGNEWVTWARATPRN